MTTKTPPFSKKSPRHSTLATLVLPSFVDLIPCSSSTLYLLLQTAITNLPSHLSKSSQQTSSLVSLATDKFYAYPYKVVPSCCRKLYVDASLVQAIAKIRRGDELGEIVRVIDMALIMAGGEGRKKELNELLETIELKLRKKRQKLVFPEEFEITSPTKTIRKPIKRLFAPSLSPFKPHQRTAYAANFDRLSHPLARSTKSAFTTILALQNSQRHAPNPHRTRRILHLRPLVAILPPLLIISSSTPLSPIYTERLLGTTRLVVTDPLLAK